LQSLFIEDVADGASDAGLIDNQLGERPSTSVQAERQSPSITTRSPVERTLAKACKYLPTWPPRSSTIRMVADAGVAPHANIATQSNRSRMRVPRPLPPHREIANRIRVETLAERTRSLGYWDSSSEPFMFANVAKSGNSGWLAEPARPTYEGFTIDSRSRI